MSKDEKTRNNTCFKSSYFLVHVTLDVKEEHSPNAEATGVKIAIVVIIRVIIAHLLLLHLNVLQKKKYRDLVS